MEDLKPVSRFTCWPSEAVSQAWCQYHSDRHQSWESGPGSGWQGAGWVSPPCQGRDAVEAETERLGRAGLQRAEGENSDCSSFLMIFHHLTVHRSFYLLCRSLLCIRISNLFSFPIADSCISHFPFFQTLEKKKYRWFYIKKIKKL